MVVIFVSSETETTISLSRCVNFKSTFFAIVWLCSDISYNILLFSHSNVMSKIYTIIYPYTLGLGSLLDLAMLMST
jgi:hypothetical protein